jgi:L-alanine-DL-glutamate epimerase-like enolase superfamily enzyme
MATLTEFELFAVDLPFRTAFRHAAAARRVSESVFVRARLDNGVEGWGESLPRPYVSGESREVAFALLRDAILPGMLGQEFASFADVVSFLEKCDGKAPSASVSPDVAQSSAWCSVDLALIDAFGHAFGEAAWVRAPGAEATAPDPLARHRYSGVVSAERGWRFALSLLKIRAFGFPQVKLKLQRAGAARSARTARRLLGRRVDLRCDANMAWDVEQALSLIKKLRPLGITSFEQPIAADDLDGLARLVRESSAGIVVDEGFTDRDSLLRLIRHRACTGVNVRISKCGGLVAAGSRCREALDAGLMVQLGCQVGESSLLSAAHVVLLSTLAPLQPGVRYAEGCFGRHLLRADPASPTVQFGYGGRPPARRAGPGLGVHVDMAALDRWSVEKVRVS